MLPHNPNTSHPYVLGRMGINHHEHGSNTLGKEGQKLAALPRGKTMNSKRKPQKEIMATTQFSLS